MATPLISVVIPVYNVAPYLERCLNSIINQTYQHLEILCVDDGSTDESLSILELFKNKDSRIQVITQSNRGPSSARNAGMLKASGEFISFIDGDDELKLDTYQEVSQRLTDGVDVVWFGVEVVREEHGKRIVLDEPYYKLKYDDNTAIDDNLLIDADCSVCNKVFRLSLIKKLNIKFIEGVLYEDAIFYWSIFSKLKRCEFIKENLYTYYRHENSIMNNTWKKKEGVSIQHIYVLSHIYDFWNQQGILNEKLPIFQKICSTYFWLAIKNAPDFEKPRVLWEMGKRLRDWNIPFEDKHLEYVKQGTFQIYLGPEKGEVLEKRTFRVWERLFCIRTEGLHRVVRIFTIKILSFRKAI